MALLLGHFVHNYCQSDIEINNLHHTGVQAKKKYLFMRIPFVGLVNLSPPSQVKLLVRVFMAATITYFIIIIINAAHNRVKPVGQGHKF